LLEMNAVRDACLSPKMHLTGLSPDSLQNILKMPMERALILPHNEPQEWLPDQLLPILPEQRADLKIRLYNRAVHIQREMAGWREIVKLGIALTGRLKLELGSAQLLAL